MVGMTSLRSTSRFQTFNALSRAVVVKCWTRSRGFNRTFWEEKFPQNKQKKIGHMLGRARGVLSSFWMAFFFFERVVSCESAPQEAMLTCWCQTQNTKYKQGLNEARSCYGNCRTAWWRSHMCIAPCGKSFGMIVYQDQPSLILEVSILTMQMILFRAVQC